MRIEDERDSDEKPSEEPPETRGPERQRAGPPGADPAEVEERLPPAPAVDREA